MSTTNRHELFKVDFKIRPTVNHPLFFDMQFGFLAVWIFAESVEDANERATAIVEQLPYEIAGQKARVYEIPSTGPSEPAHWVLAAEQARKIGLVLQLASVATGADEDEFEHKELE